MLSTVARKAILAKMELKKTRICLYFESKKLIWIDKNNKLEFVKQKLFKFCDCFYNLIWKQDFSGAKKL